MSKKTSKHSATLVLAFGTLAVALSAALPAWAAAPAATTLTSVTAVACPSASHCWAGASDSAGSAIIATSDGGEKWSVQYTTTKFGYIVGLDCTSITHCVAVADTGEGSGVQFLETTNGGEVWSTHAAPKALGIAEALSCSNGSDCWTIGLADDRIEAAMAHTTDGGAVWTPQAIPPLQTAMSNPFGISCTSSTRCLATGEASLTTTNGGTTWTKRSLPFGAPFGPVTCPSSASCYAIFDVTSAIPSNEETYVYTSTNGGDTWKDALPDPSLVAGLDGISCPSTTTCVAVGGGYTPEKGGSDALYGVSESTSNGAKTWTKVKVTSAQYLIADSCVSKTSDCVAVGSLENRVGVIVKTTDDGARWASEALPKL